MDKELINEILKRLNSIELKIDKSDERLKRVETKQTHDMDVRGLNTKKSKEQEFVHDLISFKEYDGYFYVDIAHRDVPIRLIEKKLEGYIGEIPIYCGNEFICLLKK